MHHGVRTKWPPRLGTRFGLPWAGADRLANAEIGGGKRVGQVQGTHREVVRGPGPDAGQRGGLDDEPLEISAIEPEPPCGDGAREPVERRGARARQPDLRDRGAARGDHLGGRGEPVREPRAAVMPSAERRGEPARERGRGCDRDLLAEHRTHGGLERIDRTGQSQARPRRDEWREHAIALQRASDHIGPRIEIEQPARARDQRHQHRDEHRAHRQHERVAIAGAAHLDRPDHAIDVNDPAVHAGGELDDLDARDRAGREEPEHVLPVVRRAEVEAQRELARSAPGVHAAQP